MDVTISEQTLCARRYLASRPEPQGCEPYVPLRAQRSKSVLAWNVTSILRNSFYCSPLEKRNLCMEPLPILDFSLKNLEILCISL